jgi:O-antigen/teichoic acid export membrane protein
MQTAVRQITLHRKDESDYLGTALVLACAVALPAAVLCAVISGALATNTTMLTAGLILSATILGLAPSVVSLVFQVRVRNDLTVIASTVNTLLWSLVVVAIAARHGSMIAYAIGYFFVWTLTAGLQTTMAARLSRIRFTRVREFSGPLLRAGLPLGLTSVLVLSYSRIDQVFVFRLAGDRAASLYGAVYRILDQAQFIPVSLMTTMFPLFVAAMTDPPRLKRLIRTTSEYLYIVAVPCLVFGIVAAEPAVVFLFGRSFASAAPALSLLMVTYVLLSYGLLYTRLLVAQHLQAACLRFALCGLVVNVVLNLLLVPTFGFIAAAAVTVATQGLVLALSIRRNPRHGRALPSVRVLWTCLVAAGAMAGAVILLRAVGAPFPAIFLGAAAVYLAAIACLRVIDSSHIRDLMSRAPVT